MKLGYTPNYVELTSEQLPFTEADPHSFPILVAMLRDPDWRVSSFAAGRLFSYGDRAAPVIPMLIKIIEEDNGPAVINAFDCLKVLAPSAAAKYREPTRASNQY